MKKKFWKDWLLQTAFALLLLLVFGFIAYNSSRQLAASGIASGFGFMNKQAGFGIGFHLIAYDEQATIARAFAVGLVNTLFVSAIGIVVASLFGLLVALFRLSGNPLLEFLGVAYVETLRNIPLLLQLFLWYFAVLRELPLPRESWKVFDSIYLNIRGLYIPFPEEPEALVPLFIALVLGLVIGHYLRQYALSYRLKTGRFPSWNLLPYALPVLFPALALLLLSSRFAITKPYLEGFNFSGGFAFPPELIALVMALGLYTASFISEIIRGSLLAVAKGQREAALALGLSPSQTLRLVTFPQALRLIIPPLTSQYLNLTKNSSLAAAIAFPDLVLVFAGTTLNVTGQAVEIMVLTLGVYLVLSLSLSWLMNRYQERMLAYEH